MPDNVEASKVLAKLGDLWIAWVLAASAAIRLTEGALKKWLSSLLPSAPLHIERNYDPSELLFKFGRFTANVHKHATYMVADGRGGWKKVTADDPLYQRKHRQPQQGRLEFFAQTLSFHTMIDEAHVSREALLLPSVLSKASASATYSAIEHKTPELTRETLRDLAAHHPIITVLRDC